MTRRRWIADEFSENQAALTGEHADHLIRVLRARIGQEFDISTGARVRRARITQISAGRVDFELREEVPVAPETNITLLLSIFKFDRMEWAIEKCTELGVSRIVPVIAHRTDSHLAAAAVKRVERWRRIATQATEQSRRASQPEIADPAPLRQAADRCGAVRIVLAESEDQTTLGAALSANANAHAIALAIGPEGGWTKDELDLFQQNEWISASLGPTILRAETAAVAATAICLSALDR
ncbi:MAG TPA: RsmE family RNA methyltransferase [Candidatus Sulfotelmatobacter sp.]|jgi:16S rRNA (uracil1498-N3)-methyltransferase